MWPGTSSSAALTKFGGIFCGGDRDGPDVKTNTPQLTYRCVLKHGMPMLNVSQLKKERKLYIFCEINQSDMSLPDTLHSVCVCPRRPAAASCVWVVGRKCEAAEATPPSGWRQNTQAPPPGCSHPIAATGWSPAYKKNQSRDSVMSLQVRMFLSEDIVKKQKKQWHF